MFHLIPSVHGATKKALAPTLVATAIALAGCAQTDAPSLEEFKTFQAFLDVTEVVFSPPPNVGGWPGLALFDFDNDGDIDIYIAAGGGIPNRLYRNDGSGRFADVAQDAGVALTDDECVTVGLGDFDNDGWLDLIVGRQILFSPQTDPTSIVFLRNLGPNADGIVTFQDLTEQAGLSNIDFATSLGVGDIDNDGLLDLYVGRYDMREMTFRFVSYIPDSPNILLRNTGIINGVPQFTDITESAGVGGTFQPGLAPETANLQNRAPTWAVYLTDVNHDGWLDIFALHEVPGGTDLFINNKDQTFTSVHADLLNKHGGWMGIDGADYDRDGDQDYFLTNVGADAIPPSTDTNVAGSWRLPDGSPFHRLLRNDDGALIDLTTETHVLQGPLPPTNTLGGAGLAAYEFGFGCNWFDVQNDGWPDLCWIGDLVANLPFPPGRVDFHGVGRFLNNNGDGSFTDQTAQRGLFNWPAGQPLAFGFSVMGRAQAAIDLTGNGFVDLCRTNFLGTEPHPFAFRCLFNPANTTGHWLIVRLRGTASNRFGIGARIRAQADGKLFAAEVLTTESAFTAVHPQAHFGLGDVVTLDSLTVNWPSGKTTTLSAVPADQVLTIHEP